MTRCRGVFRIGWLQSAEPSFPGQSDHRPEVGEANDLSLNQGEAFPEYSDAVLDEENAEMCESEVEKWA